MARRALRSIATVAWLLTRRLLLGVRASIREYPGERRYWNDSALSCLSIDKNVDQSVSFRAGELRAFEGRSYVLR